MPVEPLRGWERVIVPVMEALNTQSAAKRIAQTFQARVAARWVIAATRRRMELHGIEPLLELQPPRSVILVANHRTFFDMYVACGALYARDASWLERLYFPVRWRFFYTAPGGLLVNLLMSGGAMWPPVFQDDRRHTLNPVGVDQMRWLLMERGNVIGIHPEGKRNLSEDPYHLLPAYPGLGQLLLAAPPDTLVIPIFLIGLTNQIGHELHQGLRAEEPTPIRVTYGSPVSAEELTHSGTRSAKDISQHALELVRALGEQDRARQEAR
jgi:1-acyl-sn-glycerol-3-phosphate acyltransferase